MSCAVQVLSEGVDGGEIRFVLPPKQLSTVSSSPIFKKKKKVLCDCWLLSHKMRGEQMGDLQLVGGFVPRRGPSSERRRHPWAPGVLLLRSCKHPAKPVAC